MKTVALLELGEDYMRAGLLDRAEALFSDLVAMDAHAPSALRHLIAIYQHERDWHKAIEHARRLEVMTGEDETADDRPVLLRAGRSLTPAWCPRRGA
jgi:lipopolysaccharide biosynthesis regulator YciM